MELMSECRQAKKSTEGRGRMVCTRSPRELWLRKRRWEAVGGEAAEMDGEGPQLSQDTLRTFSGVGCGALEGLTFLRPLTLSLRCQKERAVVLLPPQGWPGRGMLVPEPLQGRGSPLGSASAAPRTHLL